MAFKLARQLVDVTRGTLFGQGCVSRSVASSPAADAPVFIRSGRQPELAQEWFDLGSAAAELDEGLHGVAAPAALEDRLQEASCGADVVNAVLLECAEGIGGENLGPLVAVVARRIAAGEHVLEAVRKAVEGRRGHDRDFGTYLGQRLGNARPLRRRVLGVQPEIEQPELELTYRLHPGLEAAGRLQALERREWQRLAGVDMRGNERQHFAPPREVFHELARQLDR